MYIGRQQIRKRVDKESEAVTETCGAQRAWGMGRNKQTKPKLQVKIVIANMKEGMIGTTERRQSGFSRSQKKIPSEQ
jgi:hypothetical protein